MRIYDNGIIREMTETEIAAAAARFAGGRGSRFGNGDVSMPQAGILEQEAG